MPLEVLISTQKLCQRSCLLVFWSEWQLISLSRFLFLSFLEHNHAFEALGIFIIISFFVIAYHFVLFLPGTSYLLPPSLFFELCEKDGGWLCFRFTAGSHLCQVKRLKESDKRRVGDSEKQMEDRAVRQRWQQEREREGMKGSLAYARECRIGIHKIKGNDCACEYKDCWKNRLTLVFFYSALNVRDCH